jgi:hypothetical protein
METDEQITSMSHHNMTSNKASAQAIIDSIDDGQALLGAWSCMAAAVEANSAAAAVATELPGEGDVLGPLSPSGGGRRLLPTIAAAAAVVEVARGTTDEPERRKVAVGD